MNKIKWIVAFSFLILCSSCTKKEGISERDDILGTWALGVGLSFGENTVNIRTEWNFSDSESGTYSIKETRKNGEEEEVVTVLESSSFNWEKEDGTYLVFYTNADLDDTFFTVEEVLGVLTLYDEEGALVASKEFSN